MTALTTQRYAYPKPKTTDDGPSARGSVAEGATVERTGICECGHPIVEHAWSGWGENTVCVEALDNPSDGWHGVCPCVRRGEEFS